MKSHLRNKTENGAGSLIELMMILAIGSCLLAVGMVVITNIDRGTKRQKLVTDVAALNASVKMYEANGGDLSKVTDAGEVIRRLKSESLNGISIAGLRGSFVDARLDIKKAEKEGESRAVWDAASRRFALRTEGEGVAQFVMNDAASEQDYGAETRKVALQLAKQDHWIWDYTDRSLGARSGPGSGAPSSYAMTEGDEAVPQLAQPMFSVKGGVYPLSRYPMNVYLQDPNPPGTSRIHYSVVAGEWKVYGGESIQVQPGSSIEVYGESLETSTWRNSDKVLEYYGVEPIPMELAFAFPRSAYGYKELGGSMVPGEKDPGFEIPRGRVQITNRDVIERFLVYGMIELRASVNGGAEVILPIVWDSLSGTFDLNLIHFGSRDRLDVSARAVSKGSTLGNSQLVTTRIGAETRRILTPSIKEQPRPDGLFIYGEHYVEINLDSMTGEIPAGARIYYTTDGTDPGEGTSKPAAPSAILYEKPFLVQQPDGRPIMARVYGPTGTDQWFVASTESKIVWPLVVTIGFTMDAATNGPAAGTLTGLGETLSAP